jgi:hypothetical protein
MPSNEILIQSVACNTSGLGKYFPQNLTSVGIVWSIDQEGRKEVEYILQQARELQSLLFHPSLLSLHALQVGE